MSARECAERKRERRRAWRSRLRAIAREERRERRTVRALAVERERGRRGDDMSLRVAAAIEMLSGLPRGGLTTAYRERVRRARAARSRVTVLQGDRLAQRAEQLARLAPEVIDGVPVQSTARVAVIVETSDTVIPTGEREGLPVTWVYDGDSIETYRRVVALRSKGGAS